MTEIYGRSCGNLVHLADDAPLASRAMESLQSIVDIARREMIDFHSGGSLLRSASAELLAAVEALDSTALVELYGQPLFKYVKQSVSLRTCAKLDFRRLWILQEFVVSPKNIILYGDLSFDVGQMSALARWLVLRYRSFPDSHKHHEIVRIGTGHLALWISCHRKFEMGWPATSLTLWELINSSRLCSTTVLHDRLYALLGLHKRNRNLSAVPPLLKPSYGKPIGEVFRDATRFMIHEQKSLDILQDGVPKSHDSGIRGLPSWVPRWFRIHDVLLHPPTIHNSNRRFRASGDSLPSDPLLDETDLNCISMIGLTIDHVDVVLPKWSYNSDDGNTFPVMVQWITAIQDEMSLRHIHNTQKLTMTLMAGMTWDNREPTEEDARGLAVFMHLAESTEKLHLCAAGQCKGRCGGCFAHSMSRASKLRRVFFTRSSFMGLGNEDVETGDELVVLQGGGLPFVLRPVGGDYTLVCVCYVHGIMHGEALGGAYFDRLKTFNIR